MTISTIFGDTSKFNDTSLLLLRERGVNVMFVEIAFRTSFQDEKFTNCINV